MRRGLITICLFFLLASFGSAAPLSPAELKDLLARIRAKRAAAPQAQADFREEKMIRLMKNPILSTGRLWFEAPNKFRREVKGNAPSVTVSDGQQLWIYYPNFKSAEHYTLGRRSPLDAAITAINAALNLENVENDFRITGNKIDSGYELELLPRSPSMKRMFEKLNLRIDQELLAERTVMSQQNGDRIVTTYANQTRGPISASTFQFAPPPGTDITTPLGR
jgi:outer membrane lipoprotein carrier protein